jgi:hypothetical protein
MTAILREDPPELPDTVAPLLRQIVAHCLEKEPERRFHSARDLAFALRTVTTPTASRPSGSLPPVAAPRSRKWLWPAICGALLLVILLSAVPYWLQIDPIDLATYRFQPFANEHDPETDAARSPDGKSIAYLRTVDGVPQLMVRALNSATPIQLTHETDAVSQPFWAPDSSVLYYSVPAGCGELWAISPAGGAATRILDDLRSAAISPDGKSLAIWRTEVRDNQLRASVWISSPPGAPAKPYRPAPFEALIDSPFNRLWFSPDGSKILACTLKSSMELWCFHFRPAARRHAASSRDSTSALFGQAGCRTAATPFWPSPFRTAASRGRSGSPT